MQIGITLINVDDAITNGIYFSDKKQSNALQSYRKMIVVYFEELERNIFFVPGLHEIKEKIRNKYLRFQKRMRLKAK